MLRKDYDTFEGRCSKLIAAGLKEILRIEGLRDRTTHRILAGHGIPRQTLDSPVSHFF